MSIESLFTRIATALETIAAALSNAPVVTGATTNAPVLNGSDTPPPPPPDKTPPVEVLTAEQLNAVLVEENTRLGNNAESAALIRAKMLELGVSGAADCSAEQQPALIQAIKALVAA